MRALMLGLGVVVLSLTCLITPAGGQQPRRYIRLSLGSTQLQSAGNGFPAPSSSQPTLTLGFALTNEMQLMTPQAPAAEARSARQPCNDNS